MRVAILGIVHESLIFSPIPTPLSDFTVLRGQEVLKYPNLAPALEKHGIEAVPVLTAQHRAPSGMVAEDAYLSLRQEIIAGLEQVGQIDAVLLLLHGAMVVENVWSGETDLVRTVRSIVGREPLIAARLDPHCNLTEEFASKTDIWTAYRTAPHRDQAETLERTVDLLVRAHRNGTRPRPVFIRVPLLLQGEKSTTPIEPMKSLLAAAAEIEQQPGILNADVMIGFGWADAPHSGANINVTAESVEHLPAAREHAMRLAQTMWDRRDDFTFDQHIADTVDEAIDMALAAPESSVFVTDSGDNSTAGAPGDGTYFISRLIAKNVQDAVVAGIADAETAAACFEAGLGATVSVTLGGKIDKVHGPQLNVTGVVEHLYEPPAGANEPRMATLDVGGIHVIVSWGRRYFASLEDIKKAGLNALEHKIVVIKLGYLLAQLRDAAPREIMALSPGYSDMDLTRLPYKYVTRPVWPLDTDFTYRPVITNVTGWSD